MKLENFHLATPDEIVPSINTEATQYKVDGKHYDERSVGHHLNPLLTSGAE